MGYKEIDMSSYTRKNHFDYFRALQYPYVGLTANVDITDFMAKLKERSLPFFLSFYYCAVKAANSVPELRQRIRGEGIVEYDHCPGSYTVALPDDTYCYCNQSTDMPFADYLPKAKEKLERAKQEASLDDGDEAESLLFISCITGVSFTSIVNPVPCPADSNPRITWGKYFTQERRLLIPVSVLCNHALVDGKHFSDFYTALDKELEKL